MNLDIFARQRADKSLKRNRRFPFGPFENAAFGPDSLFDRSEESLLRRAMQALGGGVAHQFRCHGLPAGTRFRIQVVENGHHPPDISGCDVRQHGACVRQEVGRPAWRDDLHDRGDIAGIQAHELKGGSPRTGLGNRPVVPMLSSDR